MALVSFLIGQAFYEPIPSSPDYLDNAYPNRVTVIIGILLEFISALAVVLIPVLLFPILKKHNEVLALGYVSFRLFEAVLLSVAQIYKLSLVNLSQDYLDDWSWAPVVRRDVAHLQLWLCCMADADKEPDIILDE